MIPSLSLGKFVPFEALPEATVMSSEISIKSKTIRRLEVGEAGGESPWNRGKTRANAREKWENIGEKLGKMVKNGGKMVKNWEKEWKTWEKWRKKLDKCGNMGNHQVILP